jgi:hypothetical protein
MITEAQNRFITYVRTKMFWQHRFKNVDVLNHVFIPMKEIRESYFSEPTKEIQQLVNNGLLDVKQKATTNQNFIYTYKVLNAGGINISLLKPPQQEVSNTEKIMRGFLKLVSLKKDAPSTIYFDTFLMFNKTNVELFFRVDEFSKRVHTPVSSFHREFRQNILIGGKETTSIDVVTMQPLLLGKILQNEIGENEYSNWINSGVDIYLMLQKKAKLNTRDEAKKRFFEILFSKPNEELSTMFGNSNWIKWINNFKSLPFKSNPHTIEKQHSNLAWLLQSTEVNLMQKIWKLFIENNIQFLSVHDEVIIKVIDYRKAKGIFESVMSLEFDYFKLSTKNKPVFNNEPVINNQSDFFAKPYKNLQTIDDLQFTNFSQTYDWDKVINEAEAMSLNNNIIAPLKLNDCSLIIDVPKFINSHLEVIKSNKNNKTFIPYLNRLQELKHKLIN